MTWLYCHVWLEQGPVLHDIAYSTTRIKMEHGPGSELIKDITNLTFMGILWNIYYGFLFETDCV